MPAENIICVENLSKCYLVGHSSAPEKNQMLRDTVVRHSKNFARKAFDMMRGRQIIQGDEVEEFWALKDVSFEVKQGEVLGVIGRNGAGKSTLLKVLSRITEPTKGRVTLHGRIASLLEVGTGFHPELSGRENIFLNGAILGMSRSEIRERFDQIVEFAGVETFLDTPVKRYSSGMYVRLAFAVAAHLDPEILVVDEVLAVGDAEFQNKCLGKMQDVAAGGRTVLFVSHNMGSIRRLCDQAILLKDGKLSEKGDTDTIISKYQTSDNELEDDELIFDPVGPDPQFLSAKLEKNDIRAGEDIPITTRITTESEADVTIEVEVQELDGTPVCYGNTYPFSNEKRVFPPGEHDFPIVLKNPMLSMGKYRVRLILAEPLVRRYPVKEASFELRVIECDPHQSGYSLGQLSRVGSILIDLQCP